jgi:hypothetical protein
VLPSTSRYSQPLLELCKVLSDYARAFSRAPESIGSDGGAFRMLQDFTIRIVKFCSCLDLCIGPWETWCRILTPVVLRVPSPEGISSNILVLVIVTRFATSYRYGVTEITEMETQRQAVYFLKTPG